MRDFHLPGRSTVRSMNGMAATSHPAATLTAIDVLRAGGNAVDAAVAAAAVLGVVEPHSTGIGGDCFALYAPKGSTDIVAVNGSGRAPAAATAEWDLDNGFKGIPLYSPHAVTIPGAVDAWSRLLTDHGTKGFAELLQPAIDYAEQGYVVHGRIAQAWSANAEKLSQDPTSARVFLPDGKALAEGDVHRQVMLAETMKTIVREGRDGFYAGPVAEDMVTYLNSLGALHTLDDFESHETEYVTPIKGSYRGLDVYQVPPNNPGITALLMLHVIEGFDLASLDPLSVERFHLEAEVARLAYNVRETDVGDPAFVDVPVDKLLSEEFATELRSRIDPRRAMELKSIKPPTAPDTVYLCVVDADRNAISFINSISYAFGTGLLSPNTGVMLQNRGSGFRVEPGHPNCIAPRKRPLHTIMPGMLAEADRVLMPYGVMGGQYQPTGHTHVLTNILDYGMDVQAAIDFPRAFHFGDTYLLERGLDDEIERGLQGLGHQTARPEMPHGGGQAIWIDWERGTLAGGSEPRKDGCALGY
ncbi:MAG: gamma-glutamyltransferase [Alphaproteobacteria bacterium]|nr:gamma-glutamyltransferase [Alphaproteobacteria bacterium]